MTGRMVFIRWLFFPTTGWQRGMTLSIPFWPWPLKEKSLRSMNRKTVDLPCRCWKRSQSWSTFVSWYNEEHRHSAISFVTPAERHAGLDTELLRKRIDVYEDAKKDIQNDGAGLLETGNPLLLFT